MNTQKEYFSMEIEGKQCWVSGECPHRGGRLSYGSVDGKKKTLTCPLHYARFNLKSGQRISGPACENIKILQQSQNRLWNRQYQHVRIKLCEFESLDAAYEAASMEVDALGFHFFKHHLFQERLETFGKIFKYLPLSCEKTLLSDLDPEPLKEVLNTLSIDTLQLYPDWSVEFLTDFRAQFPNLRILKVMSAQPEENNPANDLEFLKIYQSCVDGFLLDSFRRGGTGIAADWDHCANIVRQTPLPVFLAGGLTTENVGEAIRKVKPFGVDVENGVSIRIAQGPLVKNMEKCRDFVLAVKGAMKHRSMMSNMMKGILFVLVFNLLSAAKGVFLGSMLQHVHPIVVLFSTFFILTLFLNFFEFRAHGFRIQLQDIQTNLWNVVLLNLSTAGSWISFFYAMKHLEPAVASALCNGMGPIIVCLNSFLKNEKPVSFLEIISSIGILSGMFYLMRFAGYSWADANSNSSYENLFGIAAAISCGFFMSMSIIYSKRLNNKGWSAQKILSQRFLLLILFSGIFTWFNQSSVTWSSGLILKIFAISFIGIILPLYSLQLGIKKLEPILVSLITSMVPLFVFFFQSFDQRLVWSFYSLTGSLIVVGFSLLGILRRFFVTMEA